MFVLMEYIKVSIETKSEAAEALADELAYITGGCEVDDPAAAGELFSPRAPRWDYIDPALLAGEKRACAVCFYLAADADGERVLREVCELLARVKADDTAGFYGRLSIDISPMENQDWQNSWKQYFKPTEIGSRLIVRPSWEPPTVAGERVELIVDPSSSFGTGTHATTKMCLLALDEMEFEGKRVLDIGCGSGILACAALLLGAKNSVCCDIEQASMVATAENMARNDIGIGRYTTVMGDILERGEAAAQVRSAEPYDIILANIVSDVLIAMAGELESILAPGGSIVLSGIIDERAREVERAFCAAGLATERTQSLEGWTMLLMRRL